jgi:hypothetical protein
MPRKSFKREETCWRNMLRRCRNPRARDFKWYGGRGIRVCDRWLRFRNFLDDMGPMLPGMTIDRRDPQGEYAPDNCRWIPKSQQNRNRQIPAVKLTARGETLYLVEWAQRVGVQRHLIGRRLKLGWPVDEAIFRPVTPAGARRLGNALTTRKNVVGLKLTDAVAKARKD